MSKQSEEREELPAPDPACQCKLCKWARDNFPTTAEVLLDLVTYLREPRHQLIITEGPLTTDGQPPEVLYARLRLALDLDRAVRRNPSLMLRAVMENWTPSQVTRELY